MPDSPEEDNLAEKQKHVDTLMKDIKNAADKFVKALCVLPMATSGVKEAHLNFTDWVTLVEALSCEHTYWVNRIALACTRKDDPEFSEERIMKALEVVSYRGAHTGYESAKEVHYRKEAEALAELEKGKKLVN